MTHYFFNSLLWALLLSVCTGFRAPLLPTFSISRQHPRILESRSEPPSKQTQQEYIQVGTHLVDAGECISKAACILPNWYSSKEGLTGESPAVFGSAGTALCQAGESLSSGGIRACISDLYVTACALEPIGLEACMEAVAIALESSATTREEDNASSSWNDRLQAAIALEESANEFDEYGKALDAEEHQSDHDRDTAGGLLHSAATSLRMAADSLRRVE